MFCNLHGSVLLCLPLQKEEEDEVAGLDEEADLPLEELLARYGNYHLHAQQDDGTAEGERVVQPAVT
jgi:hypothetical protein